MKNITRAFLTAIIALSLVFSLSACTGGIDGDEAKSHINGFFDAVETDNYELAETYLHPQRPIDLKAFFAGVEKEEKLDFSSIEIVKYSGVSFSYYRSEVKGSRYELEMDVQVGGKAAEIEIEIVKNDNGYGIYNIDIDS